MFTIQYEAVDGTHKLWTFEGRYHSLVRQLIEYDREVTAVYEQATAITKRVRVDMLRAPNLMLATPAARRFMSQG
jgi:hypothetical protein